MSGSRSLPRRHRDPDTDSRSSGSGGDDTRDAEPRGGGGGGGSIPIRVIHERRGQPRYGAGPAYQRNTTDLPAKAAAAAPSSQHQTTGSESPRLERAASEPPHKFKQRLNISAANPGLYSTIPENGDTASLGGGPQPPHTGDRNPIKTSASAPSVPASADLGGPVAPPRRSPPRAMSGSGAPQPVSGTNVRHIPIFVEGRPEPIFNPSLASAPPPPQQQEAAPVFPKPSAYYPPGVQRVRSREEAEPTTPLGPPPGPIPMGYTPAPADQAPPPPPDLSLGLLKPDQPLAEPTTPQGPPPGPIPMGYIGPLPQDGSPQPPCPPPDPEAADLQPLQPPVPPQRHRTPPQPQEGGRRVSAEVAGSRKSSAPEAEGRKEPQVNVIPIRLEAAEARRPESPSCARPRQPGSRTPSQEPARTRSPAPAPAPAPARGQEQPKHSPAPAQTNPKIIKLEKIKEDVESLTEKIENFKGFKTDKEYLYLEEMLTRHLLSLDGIEPEGETSIRQMRKESINSVNRCLSLLDRKVSDVNTDAAENDRILSELAEKSLENSESNSDKKDDNQGSL